MSRKQLLSLAAIAGVLLAVFLLQRLGREKPDLERELGLKALAPANFLASDVSRIEVFRGAKKDKKVLLAREDGGWLVKSKYDAPAKKDKLEEFLKKMKSLEGEYRSEEPAVLDDYQLTEEKALHLAVYRQKDQEAWYHLLVGKQETYGRSFVRRAGENQVYTVNVNLAAEVGLWGDEPDKTPESSEWVDKTVVDLDKEEIERIALSTPDRSLVLEKREKTKEAPPEKKAEKKEEEKKQEKKEFEWVVAQGGLGMKLKQSGVDGLLSALDSFAASDVEDPAKKKELGLDQPGFRGEVERKGGKKTVLVAARQKPEDDAYLMVVGKNLIYKVADWKFNDLFIEGKDLFELKGLSEDKEKVRRITLVYPSGKLELSRKEGGVWELVAPSLGLRLKENQAKEAADALAGWTPADYVDGSDLERHGLAQPERQALFTLDDGRKHTLALGLPAKGLQGHYARLDEQKCVWVASKGDVEKLLPAPKEFFEMNVADISDTDIMKITIEREKTAAVLERKDTNQWNLSLGQTTIQPDQKKVTEYLERFSPVTAADVLLGETAALEAPAVTLRVEAKGETKLELCFGPEKEGKCPAWIAGKQGRLLFSAEDAGKLTPALRDLVGLTVIALPADQAVKVVVEREKDPFELQKKDGSWKLRAGGQEQGSNAEAVSRYLGAFADLKAEDVSAGPPDLAPEGAKPVITITPKDQSEITLLVGQEREGRVALRKKGYPLLFWVGKDRAAALAPASAGLAGAAQGEKKDQKAKEK